MSSYIEKYPWLRLLNMYTGKLYVNHDAMDEMPFGWKIAFGEMMCEELDQVIRKHALVDKFIVLQIKEKFGQLKFYHNYRDIDEINMIVEKYSLISAYVCIHCGQPQAKILNLGWIQPICRKCFSEKHANDEKYDYDSLAVDFPEMPEKIEYRKYQDKEIPRKTLEYEIVMIDVKDTFDKIMAEWFS